MGSKRGKLLIPTDLTHAVDQDPVARARWNALTRAEHETLGYYVDQTRTRWGRRRRIAEVLRLLRSGEYIKAWQTEPGVVGGLMGSMVTPWVP
jgi:uncharacterized protein YdeI (YjbR/CyaY-like superfamily)